MGDRATVEFDHHGQAYARDWVGILRELRHTKPVAYTEAHGGYWVLTKHADILFAEKDWETFSCDNDINNERGGGRGVSTPPNKIRFPLTESDPPFHTTLRRIEWPFFTPKGLVKWGQLPAALAQAHIDLIIERGDGDLCLDIALPISARTTMRITGIPDENWEAFAVPAHALAYTAPDHPDYPLHEMAEIQLHFSALVNARRANPRDDIASAIAAGMLDGELISNEIAVGMLSALVFGGFDTTAQLVVNSLVWLEGRSELYDRLISDNKYMASAVEEMLRVFPSVCGTSRTVTKEIELRGQRLMPGDRVFLSYPSGNRDEEVFDNPDEVRLDRSNGMRHVSFGGGNHTCLGAQLARMEAATVIRAVLSRIPDYRIDRERAIPYPRAGRVLGWQRMPITFTPGKRETAPGATVNLDPMAA